MTSSVALVTSAGAAETDDDAPLLIAALEAVGIEAEHARWDDRAVRWNEYDLVVIKSAWDYTENASDFLIWAAEVDRVAKLRNRVDVLRWNTDKSYLLDLSADGMPIVPTVFLRADARSADEPSVADRVLNIVGRASSVVVKPTVSAGSKDTARHRLDELSSAVDHATELLDAERDVMVQPYLDSIEQDGETGLVFFNGEFSHAFRKGPLLTDGPAKVDGLYAPEQITARTPTDSEVRLGRAVLASITTRFASIPPLYARVDVLKDSDGSVLVLELELIEPSYFLVTDPLSSGRAAQAYLSALADS